MPRDLKGTPAVRQVLLGRRERPAQQVQLALVQRVLLGLRAPKAIRAVQRVLLGPRALRVQRASRVSLLPRVRLVPLVPRAPWGPRGQPGQSALRAKPAREVQQVPMDRKGHRVQQGRQAHRA